MSKKGEAGIENLETTFGGKDDEERKNGFLYPGGLDLCYRGCQGDDHRGELRLGRGKVNKNGGDRLTNIEKLLTMTEAATLAGVKRQTIHEALKSDPPRAKGVFLKGRWFLSPEEVQRVWGKKIVKAG